MKSYLSSARTTSCDELALGSLKRDHEISRGHHANFNSTVLLYGDQVIVPRGNSAQ